jgi:transposase
MPDIDALTRDELIGLCRQLWELKEALEARIAVLEEEIARLKQDPPSGIARAVPAFVRANKPPKPKQQRKKRSQSFVRHREEPTQVVEHAAQECPDCGRKVTGGWVHARRQVIDIPVVSYTVTEHRVLRHRCGVCGCVFMPSVDLSSEVVGRHRIGVGLMSLIAECKTVCRMPVRTIQSFVQTSYGLALSAGEIVEALHAVAEAGRPVYDGLRATLRESDYVHGDETGWREDGQSGYLWSFCRPDVRYYKRDASRGHQVPEGVLGEHYAGTLVSDFYGGYNYHLGRHQRCWVHFLRDLDELAEKQANDADLRSWVEAVKGVYWEARAFGSLRLAERVKARERFQEQLEALGAPYARTRAPQNVLAERIMRFLPELFTFVEYPEVPSENNAAERAIRPAVIDRKVSGGTRSAKGSQTKAILRSLFETWRVRGENSLGACQAMLQAAQAAPT